MVARGGVHHGGTCTAEQCRLRQCELILLSARLHEASFSCHFFTFLWSTDSKGRGRSEKEREKVATVPLQPALTRSAVGISLTEQLVSLSSEFVTCAFRAPQLSRAFFCGATHCVSVPSLQKSVCCPVCWYPLLRYTHDVSFPSLIQSASCDCCAAHTPCLSRLQHACNWVAHLVRVLFCYTFLCIFPSVMGESSVACFAGLVLAVCSAVSKWGAFFTQTEMESSNAPAHEDFRGGWVQLQAQAEDVRTPALPPHRGRAIRCGAT